MKHATFNTIIMCICFLLIIVQSLTIGSMQKRMNSIQDGMTLVLTSIGTMQNSIMILQKKELERMGIDPETLFNPPEDITELPGFDMSPDFDITPDYRDDMPNLYNDREEKAEVIIPRAIPEPFDPWEFPEMPETPPLPEMDKNIPDTPPLPEMPTIKEFQLDVQNS